jgi:hypothetical protein
LKLKNKGFEMEKYFLYSAQYQNESISTSITSEDSITDVAENCYDYEKFTGGVNRVNSDSFNGSTSEWGYILASSREEAEEYLEQYEENYKQSSGYYVEEGESQYEEPEPIQSESGCGRIGYGR